MEEETLKIKMKSKRGRQMKKIKKKLLTAMLYTICYRNVDKLNGIWVYESNYIKLEKKEMKEMFISKKLHNKIIKAKEKEIKTLRKALENLEESNKDLREENEDEHLENYNQRRQLLAIDRVIKEQDFNSIDNLKNKIRTILDKKELDVSKTY